MTSPSKSAWRPIATLVACLVAACARPPAPELQPPSGPGLEQLFAITGLWELVATPGSNSVLVTLDHDGGIPSPWLLPLAGSPLRRLGPADGRTTWSVALLPDGERALVRRDGDGDELSGLLLAGVDGSLQEIGAAGAHVENFVGWRRDRGAFFMATNEVEGQRFDLYEVALPSLERRLLAALPTGLELEAVAPSGHFALLSDMIWTGDIDAWLLDLRDGSRRLLSPEGLEGVDLPVAFDADEKRVFLRSSIGRDFDALVVLELTSGERRVVLEPAADVKTVAVSPGGTFILATVNEDALLRPVLIDARTLSVIDRDFGLPPGMDVTAAQFAGETSLAVLASSPRHPRDVWQIELTGPPRARRLTDTAKGLFVPEDLPTAESTRFASFDGLSVPGIVYRPQGARPKAGWPAVVWVHGGPGGQSTRAFSPLLSSIAAAGYVVFAINHRGSDGYGRRFSELDDRRHGVDDVADCVASIDFLAKKFGVDPRRVAIGGASYGGYVSLAALTFRPEAFAAGVDLYGPSNWLRTLAALRPEREAARRALERELGDPQDEAFLKAKSPLFHAAAIKRPLLVIQGANDRRVLPAESEEIVAAARAAGAEVEYLLFPDEGHGFTKRENRLKAYRTLLDFLGKHLAAPG